jgi:6-phosphogluconolactonase (cycloisomerase 2 family)
MMVHRHRLLFARGIGALAIVLSLLVSLAAGASAKPLPGGMVYTETNDASGNALVVFQRAYDGTLTRLGTVSAGGLGTGTELGSQGAVAVSDDNQWVFAVDAGSNQISSFLVTPRGPSLVSVVDSGGMMPISLTQSGDRLYVLNAGGDGNISGFSIDDTGALAPLADSTRPLSGSATNPAQILFTSDGQMLIVTERATNSIDVYSIDYFGNVSGPNVQVSSGPVPYGFAVDRFGHLIVSEAGTNTISSYAIDAWSGDLNVISGSLATKQMAPCWVTIAGNGRYVYTTDAASNAITGYQIIPNGRLRMLDKNGRTATTGAHPTDMAIGSNGRYLYARNSDGTISAYRVGNDGSLSPLPGINGLPSGATGLAGN